MLPAARCVSPSRTRRFLFPLAQTFGSNFTTFRIVPFANNDEILRAVVSQARRRRLGTRFAVAQRCKLTPKTLCLLLRRSSRLRACVASPDPSLFLLGPALPPRSTWASWMPAMLPSPKRPSARRSSTSRPAGEITSQRENCLPRPLYPPWSPAPSDPRPERASREQRAAAQTSLPIWETQQAGGCGWD